MVFSCADQLWVRKGPVVVRGPQFEKHCPRSNYFMAPFDPFTPSSVFVSTSEELDKLTSCIDDLNKTM